MDIEQRVRARIVEVAPDADLIDIDPALADTAEFCAHYGYALEDSANCIVVASKDDPPVLAACLVLATDRLDVNRTVRRHLGVRKLSFAPAELTREITGMEIGGVTPFALPDDLPLLIDQQVTARDRVIVGGGSRRLKVHVDPDVLARLPGAEVVENLATHPSSR